MRLAVAAIARQTFDLALAEDIAHAAFEVLGGLGAEVVGSPALLVDEEAGDGAAGEWAGHEVDALVVLQASFADSRLALRLARSTDSPLLLWAFPEDRTGGRLRLNSLCGINLAGFALKRQHRDYRWLYRHPSHPGVADEISRLLDTPQPRPSTPQPNIEFDSGARRRAADVRQRLAESTIGVIGDHPDGFEPCSYDSAELADATGVTADAVRLPLLFDRASAAPAADVEALRREVAVELKGLDDVDQVAVDQSLRLHEGLSNLVAERGWSAVATRCWPECFTEFGAAACTAQSLLSDAGVPASCEADAYGSVTGLVLQWLTGSPSFVADLVELDIDADTGVFWHCGLAPLSLADPQAARTATVHGNRDKPLLNEFPLAPGRVTIARFSRSGGDHRLMIGGGEMVRAPLAFAGTAGVVRFDRPAEEVLGTIMGEGLEHHYGIGYGDVRAELFALAEQLGLPAVGL
jgi:L-fucose isomerase-like protein